MRLRLRYVRVSMSEENAPETASAPAPAAKPLLSKKLMALIVAVLGALTAYFSTSCTTAQLQKADDAVGKAQDVAACARKVERDYGDLAVEPEAATVARARAALKALKACAKGEPATAAEGDAGAR